MTDPTASGDTASPATHVNRRTIVKGAAWSIPVLAVAVGAPLAAASTPCPQLPSAAAWTKTTDGQLRVHADPTYNNQAGGTYLPLPTNNANSFLSVQDRNVATGTTRITWSSSFVPVSGVQYTFTFVTNTNTTLTDPQYLNIWVGSTNVFAAVTKPGFGNPNIISGVQTHNVTWTAPSNSAANVAFVFDVPGVTDNVNRTNDDIRIGLPVITAAGCRS